MYEQSKIFEVASVPTVSFRIDKRNNVLLAQPSTFKEWGCVSLWHELKRHGK